MSSPVVSAPLNTLADNNDCVIKPPAAGSSPVSTSVAFIPAIVALTAVARPLKVFTAVLHRTLIKIE